MRYEIEVLPRALEQIRDQALLYQEEFSTGINDFLDAIEDTYERISLFPLAQPTIDNLDDPSIRAASINARKSRRNYAHDFPFNLIYKVYQEEGKVVVYQLWSQRSNRRIEPLE
ncbi:MAG: hypothetical protein AAFQ87_14050 [Bacteroidota bacterium]